MGPLDNSRNAAEQLIVIHHPLLLGDETLIDQVIAALDDDGRDVAQHADGALPAVRRAAGQDLEEDRPEPVDVGPLVCLPSVGLLR